MPGLTPAAFGPTLVTGAAGFLGANLVRALRDGGCEVHALVRPSSHRSRLAGVPGLEVHAVDLRDAGGVLRCFRLVRPSVVFHLAAPHGHPSPEAEAAFAAETLASTRHVLEGVREVAPRRLVHVASSTEYGARTRPLREADALRPDTARGRAKAAAAELCLGCAREHGAPVVVTRVFSAYGPWEPPDRLVPTLVRSVLQGDAVRLTTPGLRHDFVFVEDVVEALLRAAEADLPAGEVINVGSGRQWSNEEVARVAMEVGGREVPLLPGRHPRSPCDSGYWVADGRKARALLGWEARRSLREGLARTFAWARSGGLRAVGIPA
jgi:nucleoside-diphosphate-sugar epimerase